MLTNHGRHFALRVLPLLIASAYASGVQAQEFKLEEVIVTAQKRAERLQDVPISISAISGSQLEYRGIEGSKDLSSLAPSLLVTYGNSGSSTMAIISIRGSANGGPGIHLDSDVGTYIDGIYAGKAQGGLFDIVDLERVEVLRGPQGTLFGRNTLAGAINFVTRKPSGTFSGSVGVEVGNHGSNIERVSVDLPSMGPVNLSVAARKEARDGYVQNQNGPAAGKQDKETYRLAATVDLAPKLQAFYAFDHSDVNNVPLPVSLYTAYGWQGASANAAIKAGASTEFPTQRNTTPGIPEWETMKTDNHAFTLTYALNPNNTLKYIFSDRAMHWSDALDLDGVPANIYSYMRDTQLKTKSHELQWVGTAGRLKYVAGYYAYKEDSRTYNPQTSGGGFNFAIDFSNSVDAKAFYGQLDYAFDDKWSGSLGIRRSEDEKGVDSSTYGTSTSFMGPITPAGLPALINIGSMVPVTTNYGDALSVAAPGVILDYSKQPTGATTVAYPAVFHAVAKRSFASTTPAASLSYKIHDGLNVYGRIAKGFRAGGFPAEASGNSVAGLIAARTTPFFPQNSTTAELGFKANFWGGKAQLNGAVFQNKIKDLQTGRMIPGTTSSIVVNAGRSTYQGFELEAQLAVADGWKVGANWGHVNSRFDSFMDNSVATNTFVPVGSYIETAGNRTTSYAPKNTFNVNVDGRLAKTDWGTLRGTIDVIYTDKMYNVTCIKDLYAPNAGGSYLASLCEVPSRTLVNGRLTLARMPVGGPGFADLSLWVRNMADVKKPVNYIDLGTYRVATWTEPRMVGLSFNYKW